MKDHTISVVEIVTSFVSENKLRNTISLIVITIAVTQWLEMKQPCLTI